MHERRTRVSCCPVLASTIDISQLHAADLERPDVAFTDGTWLYATSGKCLGQGGTGIAWLVTRWLASAPTAAPEPVVAKTFREEYIILLEQDSAAAKHFQHNLEVFRTIQKLRDDHIVPVLHYSQIADNHILITPLVGESLLSHISSRQVSLRDRARLLCDSLRGLAALHTAGIVHRDFTLNNVLTRGEPVGPGINRHAAVFDFDMSLMPDKLSDAEATWHGYYEGRVSGSPDYSVPPEILDPVLMHQRISPRADVYAIGTAIFGLFTQRSIYGDLPDLSSLLFRIAEGMVHKGESRIVYPDEVPREMRPIIEMCMERDPQARFADAQSVLMAVEDATERLSAHEPRTRYRVTMGYVHPEQKQRQEMLYVERLDSSVTLDEIRRMDQTLARYGYVLEQSVGRVKGHPIFLAQPDPAMVASGQFPEDNAYRKIVTGIDLGARAGGEDFAATWLGRIRPIVDRVRQGLLTSLYKAVHDRSSDQLLLFSEYVADARFGNELSRLDLGLDEVFALALIVAQPIARLHKEGLAHNNVRPQSLLFKGQRETGEVRTMFVGLVEPSFESSAREEDVRHLAELIVNLIRPARIDALGADRRPSIAGLRDDLHRLANSEFRTPTIHMLIDAVAGGLGVIEPNFEIIRVHGGDMYSYADRIIRHSLYNKLYAT